MPYPFPRHINPAESPALLLRTNPYLVLPVCSLLFTYSYQYYNAGLFLKTSVWNQCAVGLPMAHTVSLLLFKAEARIRC